MKIEVYGVGIKINPQLEERIDRKLAKFQRHFGEDAVCQVKCSNDGPNLRRIEITIFYKKHIYRAERSAEDILTALDLAISILEGQIRKQRTKMRRRKKDFAYLSEFLSEGDGLSANEEYAEGEEDALQGASFRYKTFALRPMSREEAALQMELLGHNFFLFEDDESGKVNLVYKRKGGDYGIIDPEQTLANYENN